MKKYTVLESVIRSVLEASNSEKRRKVVSVARPEDAAPDSEQSKLTKQAEIKNKIIDEAKVKKDDNQDLDDARKVKGGETEIDLNPKTNDITNADNEEPSKKKTKPKAVKEDSDQVDEGNVPEPRAVIHPNYGLTQSDADKMKKIHDLMKKQKKPVKEDSEQLDEVGDTPAGQAALNNVQDRADH